VCTKLRRITSKAHAWMRWHSCLFYGIVMSCAQGYVPFILNCFVNFMGREFGIIPKKRLLRSKNPLPLSFLQITKDKPNLLDPLPTDPRRQALRPHPPTLRVDLSPPPSLHHSKTSQHMSQEFTQNQRQCMSITAEIRARPQIFH
jgi:hypothetical protein